MKQQKPHKWDKRNDAKCCIACDIPFRRGDMVCDDGYVNVHKGCAALYRRQLKEWTRPTK